MGPPRLSIAGMLGLVVYAALALAALKSPSDLWACVAYTTAVAVLGVATLGVFCRPKGARAVWAGFALFGWGYFYLSSSEPILAPTPPRSPFGPVEAMSPRPRLLTTKLIELTVPYALPESVKVGAKVEVEWGNSWWPAKLLEIKGGQFLIAYDQPPPPTELVGPQRIRPLFPIYEDIFVIGHSFFCILAAALGSLAARRLCPAGGGAEGPGEVSPTGDGRRARSTS